MTFEELVESFKKLENTFQVIFKNNHLNLDLHVQSWDRLSLSLFSINYRSRVHKLSYNTIELKSSKLSEGLQRRKLNDYAHYTDNTLASLSILLDLWYNDNKSDNTTENQIEQELKYLKYINIRKRK